MQYFRNELKSVSKPCEKDSKSFSCNFVQYFYDISLFYRVTLKSQTKDIGGLSAENNDWYKPIVTVISDGRSG